MKKSSYNSAFIFTFFACVGMLTASCDCGNTTNKKPVQSKNDLTYGSKNKPNGQKPDQTHKDKKQRNERKEDQVNDTTHKPGDQRNEQKPTQTKNEEKQPEQVPEAERVNKAIQALEKEAAKPGADSKIKGIYKVINYLPPRKSIQNPDGSVSRINEEKSGQELLDKIIDNLAFNELMNLPTSEAIDWLITQNLVALKVFQEQGSSYLEQAVKLGITASTLPSIKEVIDKLTSHGAQLTPEKSAALLEQLIDAECTLGFPREAHKSIFDFLKSQAPQLSADKASQLLEKLGSRLLDRFPSYSMFTPFHLVDESLKKFLETGKEMTQLLKEQGGKVPANQAFALLEKVIQKGKLAKELTDYISDLIQQQGAEKLTPQQATELLRQAVDKKQVASIYKTLIDIGADPNNIHIHDLVVQTW